MRSDKMRAL